MLRGVGGTAILGTTSEAEGRIALLQIITYISMIRSALILCPAEMQGFLAGRFPAGATCGRASSNPNIGIQP